MTRHIRHHIFLGTMVSLLVVLAWATGFLHSWQERLTDLLFVRRDAPTNILIVDIDEQSIHEIGQWPWPRAVFGALVDRLRFARAVGIDVNFKEPSRLGAADDAALAQALARRNAVSPTQTWHRGFGILTEELGPDGMPLPIVPILAAHSFQGFANLPIDPDGVVRHADFERNRIPSFAWEIAQMAKSTPDSFPGLVRIAYAGPDRSFRHVSATDVLKNAPPSEWEDAVVLIGATARDLQDYHFTPFGLMSGVEIQANIVAMLMQGRLYASSRVLTLASIVFLAMLAVGLGGRRGRFGTFAVGIASIMILYNLSAIVAFRHFFILDLLYPNLAFVASAGGSLALQYFATAKEKKFIHDSFSRYLAPQVIHQLLHDPSRLKLGGKKELLTILFSDIRNFTALSERMAPEQLTAFLNGYLSRMTEIVLDRNGVIDKYIGDAIMAFWGAPLPNACHAADAVASALAMIGALAEFNEQSLRKENPAIDIGIGINSGEATVGNMGSEKRFDYTVMGDNVNLASRLEGLTKVYRVNIIISETTARLTSASPFPTPAIVLRELDRVQVKGRTQAVTIFEVVPERTQASVANITSDFDRGRQAYYRGQWREAIEAFSHALEIFPEDGPSSVLKERCAGFLHRPDGSWQGIFEMTSK